MATTGTGSGNTEAFLIPIVDRCLRVAAPDTLKAILVYPMNALANDQRDRIRKLLAGTNVGFGVYTGETRQWGLRRLGHGNKAAPAVTVSHLYHRCSRRTRRTGSRSTWYQ